jgi:hypothetical protein
MRIKWRQMKSDVTHESLTVLFLICKELFIPYTSN